MKFKNATGLVMCAVVVTGCFPTAMPDSTVMRSVGADRRRQCERFVDGAQTYMGQQAGLGITAGIAALGAGLVGVSVANDAEGSHWEKNRKYYLLVSSAVLVPLAINFFNNASAAGKAASKAQVAIGETEEDVMYQKCMAARASYFDDRVAATEEAKTSIGNAVKDLKASNDALKREVQGAKESTEKLREDVKRLEPEVEKNK